MKFTALLQRSVFVLALPLAAIAQPNTATYSTPPRDASTDYAAPGTGAWEFTLGGSGASNQDFDNSLGGVNVSLGYYLSETLEIAVRQGVNYSNPDSGGSAWDGSTLFALDYHLLSGTALRPFVGINAGRIYGDTVNDTWAAGIEAGLKYYVKPQTFLFAMVNYAWLFDESNDLDDRFDDGAYLWNAGIGFNF